RTSQQLLRSLTGDAAATVRSMNGPQALISLSDDSPELCSSMSGMRFTVRIPEKQTTFKLPLRGDSFRSIASSDQGQVFLSVDGHGTRFFRKAALDVGYVSVST